MENFGPSAGSPKSGVDRKDCQNQHMLMFSITALGFTFFYFGILSSNLSAGQAGF
jgi:hypothetical protein